MSHPPVHDKWDAAFYAQNRSMQVRHAQETLARCSFQAGDRVLDVGCGDGAITRAIAQHTPDAQVVGVDNSPDMIRLARQTTPPELSRVRFDVMSADAIELDGGFDWIVSFSCLHWVRDQRAVWAGFKRLLKPGGRAAVSFQTDHEGLWPVTYELADSARWRPFFRDFSDPYNHWSCDQMRAFIEDAGFFIPRMDDILGIERFDTRNGLQDFLASWMPRYQHLPSPERDAFMDEVVDRYLEAADPLIRAAAAIRIRRLILEAQSR